MPFRSKVNRKQASFMSCSLWIWRRWLINANSLSHNRHSVILLLAVFWSIYSAMYSFPGGILVYLRSLLLNPSGK